MPTLTWSQKSLFLVFSLWNGKKGQHGPVTTLKNSQIMFADCCFFFLGGGGESDNEGLYGPWQRWLEKKKPFLVSVVSVTRQKWAERARDDADLGTNNSCSLLSLGRDKQGLYWPVTTLTWEQIILSAGYLQDGTSRECTDPWRRWPGHK
jgi:hypothetical protein